MARRWPDEAGTVSDSAIDGVGPHSLSDFTTAERWMAPEKLLAEWFWIDRWTRSRAFLLPMDARGVYREMLSQAWLRGARLPNDHESIRRAIGATQKEWRRAWPFVEAFWRVDGDTLVNDTQLEVYAEAKGRADRASERGLRGAQALHKQNINSAQVVPKLQPPISDLRSKNKKELSVPPKEPADPRVRQFLEWFPTEYKAKRHGADYLVKWDRDSAIVKKMLHTTSYERLQRLAQVMLSDKCDEPFIVETDRGIGILSTKFNWLSDRLAVWEAKHA